MADRVLRIDESLEEIIRILQERHDKAERKPLLIGVFGPANAGKTYLCKILSRRLYDLYGITGPTLVCSSSPGSITPPRIIVYSTNNTELYPNEREILPSLEYLFYHAGINKINMGRANIDWWNKQLRKDKAIGRDLDVTIYIYNPIVTIPNLGSILPVFDIVVANPHHYRASSGLFY